MDLKVIVIPVEVLGCPVGNLWDVFMGGVKVGRVTYHGDTLVTLSGQVGQRRKVERAIEALYNG